MKPSLDNPNAIVSASPGDLAEWETLVADCEVRQAHLTEWEEVFIANCRTRLERGNGFTQAIVSKLEQVWDRVTGSAP